MTTHIEPLPKVEYLPRCPFCNSLRVNEYPPQQSQFLAATNFQDVTIIAQCDDCNETWTTN